MNKKTIFVAIITLLTNLATYAQEKMSLENAIEFAYKNNNSIKNAELGLKDADLQIKQTKASGLPQLNAELSLQHFLKIPSSLLPDFISPSVYGVLNKEGVKNGTGSTVQVPNVDPAFFKVQFGQENTISGNLTLSQLLFSGSYTVGLRASKLYREYADNLLVSKKVEVKNQVVDAYLPALLITESVNTIDKNIQNITKLLNETREVNKKGFVEELDVDRLELALSNLKTTRDVVSKQKDLVINALKMVINYKDNLSIDDNLDKLLNDIDVNISKSDVNYNERVEYKQLVKAMELNKLNVQVNKAAYLPTFAAFGSYTQQFQGNNFSNLVNIPNALIGVSGKINIWDSWEKKTKIQRALLAVDQLNNQIKDLESVINLQVNNSKIIYQNALVNVENQKKNLVLAEKINKTTKIKYKEGIGSSFEMVQAEQELYTTQQNLKQAQYDLLVAYKSLQKSLGK